MQSGAAETGAPGAQPGGETDNGLSARLIGKASELEELRSGWDRLAVAARSPFGCPAWVEAWWRHLAPDGAQMAVIAVEAGDELVGLAPFYSSRRIGVTKLRLISGGLASRLGVVAAPGREREVAASIATVLAADVRPDVVAWEGVDSASRWPELLSAAWPDPGGLITREEVQRSGPVIDLDSASYEDWLAARGGKPRRELRRRRRKIEAEGAVLRPADISSLERDLEAFARLHFARWTGRGGSSVPENAIPMLGEVGTELIESGRFRMWMIDGPDGEAISARVLLAAGGTVAAWNKGFDERWSRYAPGILSAHAAIEEAFERGDDLFDLGGGESEDKHQLADDDRPLAWRTSYRRGARYPLARLQALPEAVARGQSGRLRRWLGTERLNRLRRLRSRG